MGIAGVGSYNYSNYYQTNVNKHSEQASSSYSTSASKGLTLYVSDGEDKALTSVACANGTSASVFKADNYTEENPQYLVKFWDENGEKHEYNVNPKEVDPSNASYLEMLAYTTYTDVQGYTKDAYMDFMSAAMGTNADIEYDSSNINEKKNYKSMVQKFMQMQYEAGNMVGYLFYKQFYDYMDSTDSKDDYSKIWEKYGEQIKEKIKNGDTEPTYQIGGQTFTEAEWKKLIGKMDKDIEQIQAEQAERLEKQKAEEVSNSNAVNAAESDVAGITRYYNGKEVNYEEDMLHDRKMYDAETGVTWYLNDQRGPYMSEEDSKKFDKWCEENGVDRLKKFAEMTGLIRNYPDGTNVYIADNGIAVKGKEGTEFSMDYSDVSWYALMDAVDQMQGNPLDKQTWNKVMQDYETKKVEANDVTEAQVQELLKDNNERRFEVYGPNAPDEVKQAWMEASEETGMQSDGMMRHITQLQVQMAIKRYYGEEPDVLGATVESAISAIEKALYDLENPLEPITNKSASVQKSIEKEKEFYKAFLEKLKDL